MKIVKWDLEKAKFIKETRNIDFEYIATMIAEGEFLGILKVPSRENQKIFILEYESYIVCVPFVENEQEIFIKPAYKNRKLMKGVNHESKTKKNAN